MKNYNQQKHGFSFASSVAMESFGRNLALVSLIVVILIQLSMPLSS